MTRLAFAAILFAALAESGCRHYYDPAPQPYYCQPAACGCAPSCAPANPCAPGNYVNPAPTYSRPTYVQPGAGMAPTLQPSPGIVPR